jgi:hypothetical protein
MSGIMRPLHLVAVLTCFVGAAAYQTHRRRRPSRKLDTPQARVYGDASGRPRSPGTVTPRIAC